MSIHAKTDRSTPSQAEAVLSPNYPRFDITMVRGQGPRLWDEQGKEYLDLFAGFGGAILGHAHPDLAKAVCDQAQRLWHVGNLLHTQPQVRAAEAISRHGFAGQSFFCHSGADANEAAIKLARLYGLSRPGPKGQRCKIISTTHSFHGRSYATMPATGAEKVRQGFGPMPAGFVNVAYNDVGAVDAAVDDDAVAVLVEPIQGEAGVRVPDDDYLPRLRELCDKHDLLLITDEVWTGCGRTGRYFAHQHWLEADQGPDIMTLGKGVGGGMAVGVMCAKAQLAELNNARTQGGVKHASTLGGHCLAMAVTAELFSVIERDGLVDHAASLGRAAVERLSHLTRKVQAVTDVRGRGLFIGIELDPTADDAWFSSAADVAKRALDQGLIINATASNVLRLAPPITITQAAFFQGLDHLEAVIKTKA